MKDQKERVGERRLPGLISSEWEAELSLCIGMALAPWDQEALVRKKHTHTQKLTRTAQSLGASPPPTRRRHCSRGELRALAMSEPAASRLLPVLAQPAPPREQVERRGLRPGCRGPRPVQSPRCGCRGPRPGCRGPRPGCRAPSVWMQRVHGLGAEHPTAAQSTTVWMQRLTARAEHPRRPGPQLAQVQSPRPPQSTTTGVHLHPCLRWAPGSSGEGLPGSHRDSLPSGHDVVSLWNRSLVLPLKIRFFF